MTDWIQDANNPKFQNLHLPISKLETDFWAFSQYIEATLLFWGKYFSKIFPFGFRILIIMYSTPKYANGLLYLSCHIKFFYLACLSVYTVYRIHPPTGGKCCKVAIMSTLIKTSLVAAADFHRRICKQIKQKLRNKKMANSLIFDLKYSNLSFFPLTIKQFYPL